MKPLSTPRDMIADRPVYCPVCAGHLRVEVEQATGETRELCASGCGYEARIPRRRRGRGLSTTTPAPQGGRGALAGIA